MAKIELLSQDMQKTLNDLQLYRSGWANDIREGWKGGTDDAAELTYEFYMISGSIILALQQVLQGHYRDKMAMVMTKAQLEKLVNSEPFKLFDELGKEGISNVVTTGTKHHIRIMLEVLEAMTA